ncbi:hypothetical protein L7I02_005465, partial [Klebsiella pneumoniae]
KKTKVNGSIPRKRKLKFPLTHDFHEKKKQNTEQVKILILACEGLTKRSAVDCPEREGLL